jgi:transcriptional regulator with XRE-family HTH domain
MLSQIEHGTARPSMTTLQYLAARLGKTVSYFLEDQPEPSPNQSLMSQARRAWAAGDFAQTQAVLAGFQGPDTEHQWEFDLLSALAVLAAAGQALDDRKDI